MRVQGHCGVAEHGANVDLAVGVHLQKATAVGVLVRHLDIADGLVGVVVAGVVRRERDRRSHRWAGEVGFVDHAERACRDAAQVRQREGREGVGGDSYGVDLAVARHERHAARRGGWQSRRAVGERGDHDGILRVLLVEEEHSAQGSYQPRRAVDGVRDGHARQEVRGGLEEQHGGCVGTGRKRLNDAALNEHGRVTGG